MPLPPDSNEPPPFRPFRSSQVIARVLRIGFLRNIFIACLAVAMLFPLYTRMFLNPAYEQMLYASSEEQALRVATYLVRVLRIRDQPLAAVADSPSFFRAVAELKTDFKIEKLKLFNASGVVIFSTTPPEIGQVNTNPYFVQKVAQGEICSQVVHKGGRSMESDAVPRDVVEVYVPIFEKLTFLGAFELYFDITTAQENLIGLLHKSNLIVGFIAVMMILAVVIILFKAGDAILAHNHADAALRQTHDDLEKRVHQRTDELTGANIVLQQEINERRQVETALRESEKRYRTLVETVPHGIREIDIQGTITFVNPAHTQIYGYSEQDLIGRSIFDLAASWDERKQLQDHLVDLVTRQPYPSPWFSKDATRDGRTIETQVDWSYQRDAQGLITGLICVVSDISHRKQAERALLDHLRFMTTLIDTIPNPVFFKDHKGEYLGCNSAYAQILGKSTEDVLGHCLIDFPHQLSNDMARQFHDQDMALIQNPGVRTEEQHIYCADGIIRDYLLFKATFQDAEGHVAGLVGIMLDISALKKVEKELKESKNLFDAFMRHLPVLAFIKDTQGRYLFVNHFFAQFSGTEGSVQTGLSDERIWDAQTARQLSDNDLQVRFTQADVNALETVRLADGRERYLLTARFPIFQENQLYALGGVAIDITERTLAEHQRRQLEIQLQQSQKMEALGTLAGGIAHDFNNILAAIIGYTEIAVTDIPKGSQLHLYLQRVLEAGERARALVKQILAFSRQGETEPRPVQVKVIVKEVLKLLRASLSVTIEFVHTIRSDAAIMADPVQIHQVMMNLCTNAGYAMREKGGRLMVNLEDVILDEDFVRRFSGLKAGPFVRLSVADTGMGIAPELLSRIFDPFFTTKPKGQGTGLGLSVVHGIVTGLGGIVTVESTPGQGARFDAFLPVIPYTPAVAQSEAHALPLGSEKILFVD